MLPMQRATVWTVTSSLPVLFPAEKGKHDVLAFVLPTGEARPFNLLGGPTLQPARIVSDAQLLKRKRADIALAGGIKLMMMAEASDDPKAIDSANALLGPYSPIATEQYKKKRDVLPAKARHGFVVAPMISRALRDARFVAWMRWRTAERGIGIYCPDVATAIAAKVLLGNIRLCLHCQKVFLPEQSGEFYCSVKCREAHRVARWRARKKAKAALGAHSRKGGA
jgi:hypothetical protein